MSTSFRPSRHGFHFGNRFDAPVFGSALRAMKLPASWGLCGGMVHLAREAFRNGEALPTRQTPPVPGSPLYRRLLRRQFVTFGPPPFFPEVHRFARWTRCTDAVLARRTRPQVERAHRRLGRGHLVPLGLVYVRGVSHLWENHQVLAYASAGERALRIYDPNEPSRDDITLAPAEAPDGPAFEKRCGGQAARPVRGFFVMEA